MSTARDLSQFEKVQKIAKEGYEEMHEENQIFSRFYQKIEEIRNQADKKKLDKVSKIESTFSELINKYKDRGYKIPDLSLKNNLFDPSPLLLENTKINDFYKYKTKEAINKDKDHEFIDKVLNVIEEKCVDNNIANKGKNNKGHSGESHQINKTLPSSLERRTSLVLGRRLSVKTHSQSIIPPKEPDVEKENEKLIKENLKKRILVNEYSDKVKNKKQSNIKSMPSLNINFLKNKNLNNNFPSSRSKKLSHPLSSTKSLKDFILTPKRTRNSKNHIPNTFVNNSIGNSKLAINKDLLSKTRTAEKLSNLETALNTDRSSYISSSSITNNTWKIKNNFKIRRELRQQYMTRLSSVELNRSNGNEYYTTNFNNPNKNSSTNPIKQNKQKFLEYFLNSKDKLDIEKMNITELKDLITDYSQSILGLKDNQIDDIINKKVDANVFYKSLIDMKNKIENFDIKDRLSKLFDFKQEDKKIKLDTVQQLDKEIKRLRYQFVKKLNAGQNHLNGDL